jgi:hypothetical protein
MEPFLDVESCPHTLPVMRLIHNRSKTYSFAIHLSQLPVHNSSSSSSIHKSPFITDRTEIIQYIIITNPLHIKSYPFPIPFIHYQCPQFVCSIHPLCVLLSIVHQTYYTTITMSSNDLPKGSRKVKEST